MTWEYLAGFFDGEGCIYINHRSYSYGKYQAVKITQGIVNEANSGIIAEIFNFLQDHKIPVRWHEDKYQGNKKFEVIASNKQACIGWLEGMLPYLRVKREKAVEAIGYIQKLPDRKIDRRITNE